MLLPTLAPKAIPKPWYIKKKTLQEELNQLAYDEERYAQETEMSLVTGPYTTDTPTIDATNAAQVPASSSPVRNDSVIQPIDEPTSGMSLPDYSTHYDYNEQNDFEDRSPLNLSPDEDDASV
ncbi:hypothetical protein BJV82DRAFT_628353 [Fennellomyces sp. T-0311]|nr:hypothetical protein BJV82DRAFT_628353 [Fennellomyces sp. T-0311]